MQISVIMQVNFIFTVLTGLFFCVYGYKFARFLLPVCGVVIIVSALYLFVGAELEYNEMVSALFYGGTAVMAYVFLFLIIRAASFFTGVFGAGLLSYLIINTFGLMAMPFALPVFVTVTVVIGLVSAVYTRVGVIVASSMFGAIVASGLGLFLVFAPGADYAAGQSILIGLTSIIQKNGLVFLGVFAVLMAAGVFVQLKFTGKNQLLGSKINIAMDKENKGTWIKLKF